MTTFMIKWLWLFALAACGDNFSVPPPPDATPPFAEAEHGAPPQLVSLGGPVLTAPRVQPIFFMNDGAMQAQVEDFDTKLQASQYWHETTSEYGVGSITALPSIVVTTAPPATEAAIPTFLASHLDGTHTAEGWPAAPDGQTIYTLFTPDGFVVTSPDDGDSCDSYYGYHDEAMGTHGESIVYAFVPRCDDGRPKIDTLTQTLSHELVEAATDPLVETAIAYGESDADNYVMWYVPNAEVADYCEYLELDSPRLVGTYETQRIWSNAAATAGKDPCVPSASPYVAAVPRMTETVKIENEYTGAKQDTKGVAIAVHESKTIDVTIISDVPTTAPMKVTAYDAGEYFYGDSESLTFSWDATTGKNGDTLHLTINRTRAGQIPGSELLLETTVDGEVVSQWYGYVSQ